MNKKTYKKNIFADKATLILRKMLQEPDRKWVVRDFNGPEGVSLGLTQQVLEIIAQKGYAERIKKGPESHTVLTYPDKLIKEWTQFYKFELNTVKTYYTHDQDILKKMKAVLNNHTYALTLHSGANLLTSYVKTDQVYIYLRTDNWDKDILNVRQKLDLKELVSGGNVHFIEPYYKTSTFANSQKIEGYSVVSNLQLFLDLYHFQPRGREQSEFLKEKLEQEGKTLGQ
ncbi:MAG TPA: type IV toxin-antitoxin system AbiEi family antitoxin [Candidatus Omnitrophota bacterium]|nr:type IV toxin-antitoxin system AbiEi family antitoxin [Candidatus Omnitrophota bacterium]